MIRTVGSLIATATASQLEKLIPIPDMIIESLSGNLPPNTTKDVESKAVKIIVSNGKT